MRHVIHFECLCGRRSWAWQDELPGNSVARLRCSECKEVGLVVIVGDQRYDRHLQFRVELWTPDGLHVDEILAMAASVLPARAAYERAVAAAWPDAWITLRHGIRVIEATRRE